MKKIWILLLAVLLLLPVTVGAVAELPLSKGDAGDDVARLQLRLYDLGYISFRPTGKYGDMTFDGVVAFQTRTEMDPIDGIAGEAVWDAVFAENAPKKPINSNIVRVYGPGQTAPLEEKGQLSDWKDIGARIPQGTEFTLIDCNTSTEIRVRRTGGVNHADVEPADAQAAKAFKEAFGGGYSWEKRAVVARIGEELYAASLFGMPNANEQVSGNELEGSLCLYFSGCSSEIGNLIDMEHNANIARAAGR